MHYKNTNLIDEIDKYKELGIYSYRVDLLDETEEEIVSLINRIRDKFN